MAATPSRAPQDPRQDVRPRRPWYLVLALIGAWVFGASGFVDGCSTVAFYRAETLDPADYARNVRGTEERAATVSAAEHYVDTMTAARKRVFPLGIAALLLGGTMIALSARAMAGRKGARGPLMQMTAAQAVLVLATHFATPDVRAARSGLESQIMLAQLRESNQPKEVMDQYMVLHPKIMRFGSGAWLTLRSVLSTLILLALATSRSRQFFDAAQERLSEQE